ncbi:Adenylate cyclase (EC [Olavius sp. associated proteobacterium Delta 1]|nr:Adenylate cyclase (EC [Olavius sp. associated proteobacterium Delta 1]
MTQEGFKRKLTAILSADAVEYSRLMGGDEEATVRTITAYRGVLTNLIQQHNGKVLDSPGDNLLAEFVSVVDAVQSAVAVQKEIKARNEELPENRRMQFRIGINLGDVIEEEGRIYGDGVNIAARLEGLADPGGICVSKTAFDHIESKLPYGYEFLGDQTVKNIAKPVGAYRVLMEPRVTVAGKPVNKKPATIRRTLILVGAVVVLALAVAVGIWRFTVRHPKEEPASMQKMTVPLPERPAIAVLPFDNMSGDPEQEYFSDGITEEIITKLSMSPGIAVIARNSTFFYKGKQIKIQQIAQELRARYVVEGSVRKAGNRVRITAQLIDASTERHLWAKTYDHEFKDIFNLQDEIAQQIVAALNIKSRNAEQARAWRVPTENLTAYDFLLRGLSHFSRLTKEEYAKAKVMFERAIELDSEFASAYVLLGYAHLMDYAFGSSRDPRTLEQVSDLARKAMSLDDSSAKAHVLLADVYRAKGRFEQAISQAERALSLNPSDPSAYRSMGNALNSVGRSEEAVKAIKKAMDLDPHHSVYYNTDLASTYRNLGQYEEAIASLEEALARNPDWIPAYFELAMNYCLSWGVTQKQDPLMLDRALEMVEKLVANDDSSGYAYFALSIISLFKKEHEKAIADAEKLIALAPERADSYALLATIFISVGRTGEAIEMVEKAMQLSPSISARYLNTLATAYALSGRQTEAVATHKRVFDHNPSHAEAFRAHVSLALLYVGLGQEEDARTEAEEILKLVPNFTVEVWGQRNPNKDQAQIEQDMAALRKAGLK